MSPFHSFMSAFDPKRTSRRMPDRTLRASLYSTFAWSLPWGRHMRRREFITLVGATAAWPLVAQAQQPERVRRIGVLQGLAADDPEAQAYVAAFQQGLQEAGWTVGRNVRIDYRWSAGDHTRLRRNAAELVALNPDVIVGGYGPTSLVLHQSTRTVPVVFAQAVDPVGSGVVESLAHPGGNLTGFTQFEFGLSGGASRGGLHRSRSLFLFPRLACRRREPLHRVHYFRHRSSGRGACLPIGCYRGRRALLHRKLPHSLPDTNRRIGCANAGDYWQRNATLICALHESAFGVKRTSTDANPMSAFDPTETSAARLLCIAA
jgi:hypothetical protein